MRNWKKRWFSFCLILIFMTVTGCGNTKQPIEEFPEEIVIWTWDDTFNVKAAKMAAAQYEIKNSRVRFRIETKEKEEILTNIKVMFAAQSYDKLPDIIMIEDYEVQEILKDYADQFVDFTDDVDANRFVDYKKQLCSKDGHYYGIPFDCGTAALFYRLDFIEAAGYKESDLKHLTWERYIEIGKKVYEKTGVPMLTLDPTDLPLIRLIMQSCGEWYVCEDGVTANIENNQALRQAIEIFYELLETNLGTSVNGWNEFISAFQEGRVASVLCGGWIMSSIMKNKQQEGLWRVTSIPVVSENEKAVAASNVGGSAWYVLKNGTSSEAAKKFMVKMFAENDEFIDELICAIELNPALKKYDHFKNYKEKNTFFGGKQVVKFLTKKSDLVPAVNYGTRTYEIEQILESELQNAIQTRNWERCLRHVQEKAEIILKE